MGAAIETAGLLILRRGWSRVGEREEHGSCLQSAT